MNERVEQIISADEESFFDNLARHEKLFGAFSTSDGRVAIGFRKVRGGVYESDKGVGIFLDPDDIRHLLNVLRLARKRAREVQFENDNACR